jgi:hypothetical protein
MTRRRHPPALPDEARPGDDDADEPTGGRAPVNDAEARYGEDESPA